MVSFELTETQRMIREMLHQFAEREMRPAAPKYDEEESVPWEVMAKAEEAGITFNYVPDPQEEGRKENPFAGEMNMMGVIGGEEFAWGCAGITIAINGTQFAAGTVANMGTPQQKRLFNQCLQGRDASGHVKVAAMGFTEPYAGSDISRITSVYVIWATVDKTAGRAGLRAFIISRETTGLIPGEKLKKMGIRASDTAPVYLEDCRVPHEWMMGEARTGHPQAKRILDATRPMVAAVSLGIARAALEYAVGYAKERVQFGEPIAKKQGVAFMLAEMATEIEAARALTWKAASLADRREPNALFAAMAKAKAAEVAMDVTTKAVQILGGYGYIRDHPVEKWMRDAKVMDIFEGTGQIQRAIIAQELTGIGCK